MLGGVHGRRISIHAPHTGRDRIPPPAGGGRNNFNPRAPYGARPSCVGVARRQKISIHAPHTGRDRVLRGVTVHRRDFNPRAPYGARPAVPRHVREYPGISIHAPHTGRDMNMTIQKSHGYGFQSTRPIRGATVALGQNLELVLFQSTRPIRGATLMNVLEWGVNYISIHAPHTGRDVCACTTRRCQAEFQSTRPIRGATEINQEIDRLVDANFNPRAPYGARRFLTGDISASLAFQSTRPIRGATFTGWHRSNILSYFNPRAPYGARPKPFRYIAVID